MQDFSFEIEDLKQIVSAFASSVCCLAELESMKVANRERRDQGYSEAHSEKDFLDLQTKYAIDHNSIWGSFRR